MISCFIDVPEQQFIVSIFLFFFFCFFLGVKGEGRLKAVLTLVEKSDHKVGVGGIDLAFMGSWLV